MNNPSDADWQAELDRRRLGNRCIGAGEAVERRLTMAHPKIEAGCILVEIEGGSWGDYLWRPAQPHEMVQALVDIVEKMQARIDELEAWRKRVQGD